MARLRLYALTTMGGFLLAYAVLTDAMSLDLLSFPGYMWTLIVIPLYAVGVWLTGGYRRIPKPFGYSSRGPRP